MFARNHITPDSALGGTQIQKSVRFNSVDTSYLKRTVTSEGNRQKWTWSGWVKRVKLGVYSYSLLTSPNGGDGGGNNGVSSIYFANDDKIHVYYDTISQNNSGAINDIVYRDIGSWYHIVWQVDSANSTSKIWVNGVEQTVNVQPVSGYSYTMNQNGYQMTMGIDAWDLYTPSDGYMAETHFSDGQLYAASDFGYTDAQTGQWRPKSGNVVKSNITYGTNGWWLDFRDSTSTTTLGYDYSGNGNHWTPHNMSVAAGAGNDCLDDTPTNNFATINPLHGTSTMYDARGGNLDFNLSNNEFAISTIYLPTSGKWYAECVFTTTESGDVGVFNPDMIDIPDGELSFDGRWSGVRYAKANGTASIYTDQSAVQTGLTLISNNDIVGILADRDAGTISFTINGTAKGTPVPISTITDSSTLAFRAARTSSGGSNVIGSFNFGQRPFSHLPTGYRSLCSKNLATPSAAEIVRPQRHFDILTWAGNSTNGHTIDGLEFTPDVVWIKNRSESVGHYWVDSMRKSGSDYLYFNTNDNGAEADASARFTSINRGGFTLPGGGTFTNSSGDNFVAWCWKAGGAAVSNSDGSITSQVSANQEAGFSVLTYTGTGSNATVGHGLGKAPKWVLVKRREATGNWAVYHEPSYTSGQVQLDTTVAPSNEPWWNGQATSSVINLKTSATVNGDTSTYVAYCWAEIPGYSKFGIYRGDGSSDGPYIHLGFKPAMFIQKKFSGTGGWYIFDSKRGGSNVDNDILLADANDAEYDGASYPRLDFLANGIKWRDAGSSVHNASGAKYIYMAFAERPSGTIFGLDANAR